MGDITIGFRPAGSAAHPLPIPDPLPPGIPNPFPGPPRPIPGPDPLPQPDDEDPQLPRGPRIPGGPGGVFQLDAATIAARLVNQFDRNDDGRLSSREHLRRGDDGGIETMSRLAVAADDDGLGEEGHGVTTRSEIAAVIRTYEGSDGKLSFAEYGEFMDDFGPHEMSIPKHMPAHPPGTRPPGQ